MAVMKCKMCGGDLEIEEGLSVAVCEYCGTKQTVPTLDNERKTSLFGRAGRLLRACEFDKASVVFGDIVSEFPEEAEAYWGLLLCKYGVEYVDDPATGKKIPTCHRLSFESIMEDGDFEQACENADSVARGVYREEAKFLENLRKNVIEVSSKEEPYDVFICYKETDANGNRTIDSVMAQDVYDALTEKGLHVFFARITLEDKLGMEYEPYIFAALNSAKVMLAIGTDYEYFNAVWVKNEWSRFLKLIAKGEKKVLIPCYKDIDAYDMPKEFKNLQAQDMGKLGFMQDLVRGVCKILGVEEKKEAVVEKIIVKEIVKERVVEAGTQNISRINVDPLLELAFDNLKNEKYFEASKLAGKAIGFDPANVRACLCKLCAEMRVNDVNKLSESEKGPIEDSDYYRNLLCIADDDLKEKLKRQAEIQKARVDERKRKEEERIAEEKRKKREKELKEIELFPKSLEESILRSRQQYISTCVHTVGIKSDGTVVAVGCNDDGQCNVQNWKNIVSVYAGIDHTVGLKFDGTVVAVGNNEHGQCNVQSWKNIVAVSASDHTVGLKSDGTVVAVGVNYDGQCNVQSWKNIVAVSAGVDHTVGLKSDGTVVAVGRNDNGQCNVQSWENIVAVSASAHTLGLKSDGTVVAVGYNDDGQCNVQNWKNIVEIFAGDSCSIGIKNDGTVVAIGNNEYGECDVSTWKNIATLLDEKAYEAKCRYMKEVLKKEKAEEQKRMEDEAVYKTAREKLKNGDFLAASKLYESITDFRDSIKRKTECIEISFLESERKELEEEYEKTGFFNVKRKKEITARLEEIKATITEKTDVFILEDIGEEKFKIWKEAKIGKKFIFGNYHGENEWLVLDKQGTKLLIISKKAWMFKQYNMVNREVVWKDCTARVWLNHDFIDETFNTEEQKMVLTTKLSETDDKVFLLSTEEAKKFFPSKEDRLCETSAYLKSLGISTSRVGYESWWLRNDDLRETPCVFANGSISSGLPRTFKDVAVRPAMWIDLDV